MGKVGRREGRDEEGEDAMRMALEKALQMTLERGRRWCCDQMDGKEREVSDA